MFIRRGSLADVRRHICGKLRHALQCKTFATGCAMRYSAKSFAGGLGKWLGKEGKQCKDRLVQE